jgi:hypothetical protein
LNISGSSFKQESTFKLRNFVLFCFDTFLSLDGTNDAFAAEKTSTIFEKKKDRELELLFAPL